MPVIVPDPPHRVVDSSRQESGSTPAFHTPRKRYAYWLLSPRRHGEKPRQSDTPARQPARSRSQGDWGHPASHSCTWDRLLVV